jgi:hypothetical protein
MINGKTATLGFWDSIVIAAATACTPSTPVPAATAPQPMPASEAPGALAASDPVAAKGTATSTPEGYSPSELAQRVIERRAVEAAIWGMPAVNYDPMLQEMLTKTQGKVNQVIYWGRPLDWHNQTLTPNPDTLYFMVFLNTKDVGPIVIEVPPAGADGALNANFVDVWQEPLEDAGLLGIDKGKGLKLLLLPPGYAGKIPKGYEALKPGTFGSYALIRSNLKSHADADVATSAAYAKRVKVYPLSQAGKPPETVFTDVNGVVFDSTIRYDVRFFEGLARIVQSEPWQDRDRAMIDISRSLGIEKDKPFAPTAEAKQALEAGVREAHQQLAARYDAGLPAFFEGTHWSFLAPPESVQAAATAFADPNSYPIDSRGLVYHYAYIGIKWLGVGQFYLVSIKDKDGESYGGGKTYHLHALANAPVEQYWSITAYDRETHALIKNMSRASRASNSSDVQKNADGSVDLYLGPSAPAGKESNYIPTDPARHVELMFRACGPTKAFFAGLEAHGRRKDEVALSESPSLSVVEPARRVSLAGRCGAPELDAEFNLTERRDAMLDTGTNGRCLAGDDHLTLFAAAGGLAELERATRHVHQGPHAGLRLVLVEQPSRHGGLREGRRASVGRIPLGHLSAVARPALQALPEPPRAPLRCHHPGPQREGRLVPHMLRVATHELRHPVPLRILMKPLHRSLHVTDCGAARLLRQAVARRQLGQ